MKSEDRISTDICVCCGSPLPEGRMVCYDCETGSNTFASCKQVRAPKGIKKTYGIKKEHTDDPRD